MNPDTKKLIICVVGTLVGWVMIIRDVANCNYTFSALFPFVFTLVFNIPAIIIGWRKFLMWETTKEERE